MYEDISYKYYLQNCTQANDKSLLFFHDQKKRKKRKRRGCVNSGNASYFATCFVLVQNVAFTMRKEHNL
jgi:hypothetical protein